MEVIQIGSFAILVKWLLLGISVIIGLFFLKWWFMPTEKDETTKKIFDEIANTLFIGFIIWKISLILLEPSLVMKSLYSLLYFTGGSNGLILAIIGSVLYFFFKARKIKIPNMLILQSAFIFSFSTLSGYHILRYFFLNGENLSHLLFGLCTASCLSLAFIKRDILTQKNIFTFTIILSFLNLILSFIYENIAVNFFLFSMEQWFFIGLIVVSLFYWDKKPVS
ncbi:hypothetical protein [Bacillus sp. 7884-1]|uniref:hypothetical protein n=1 Tax=Bacillus sp. 7884-1 TaxID=2021693 RepID=UPI000BA6395E|nr:hypothetical protein [Bacillus sp. 7884-1]PAE40873.1 hypothetical protein CHI06_14340 [Bacillus sp. 7884-1]